MNHILAVDDDIDILNLLTIILSEEGYNITTADSGKDFWDKLDQVQPDQIIVDMHLPDIKGSEIIQLLRRKDQTKNIPVLMISSDPELPEIAHQYRISNYLSKPFEMGELLQALKKNSSPVTELSAYATVTSLLHHK